MRLVDSTFAPKGYEAFTFRNGDRKLDDNEILSEEGSLDEEGRASFEVEMPAGAPVPSSLEAVVTARVQEQGGRGVAALNRLQVASLSLLHRVAAGRRTGAGARGSRTRASPPSSSSWPCLPDGKEVASDGLRADLFEDRWNTVLRKGSDGSWQYETTRDPVLIVSRSRSPAARPAAASR